MFRPMDLGTIKKNIETGVLRTTPEFQRDMMLMFTNAIMYNSTDQPVFKMATEMYNDVMQHIEVTMTTSFSLRGSCLVRVLDMHYDLGIKLDLNISH